MSEPAAPSPSSSRPVQIPSPNAPTNYQRQIYTALRPPTLTTDQRKWPDLCRAKVPAPNFGYVHDSAGLGSTCAANISAFSRYRLKPSMLRDATVRDLSVELFGRKYMSPLIAGPVGVQSILHKHGEEATARACTKLGVPYCLSSASTRTIEEIGIVTREVEGKDNVRGGGLWYQLYWPKPQYEDITASLLKRAKENGYEVLVVTLDTFTLGWRPKDLDHAYLPFLWGEGCQIGHSDPVFQKRFNQEMSKDQRGAGEKIAEAWDMLTRPGTPWGALKVLRNLTVFQKSRMWLDVMNSGTYRTWEDVKILRKLWGDGPIVLKGIQTVEDAKRAIEVGADGIVVSNHGGRQLDGAVASLDMLEVICADEEVRRSGITILFDSGIRTGTDVMKAMALGAKACLIGRPYMYGLGMAGEKGVEHVFKCLLGELDNGLAQMGKTSLRQLSWGDLMMQAKL